MRNPTRIKRIINLCQKTWEKSPDLRFTQLVLIITKAKPGEDIWNMEDDEFEKKLKEINIKWENEQTRSQET